ncbi:hypothetical protein B0A48_04433 [Cryoendolithus antarcticus]|uniref:Uncharacterized protein n=1 Tax=Cryoendolithus antarcticus TaxID=1507870 RepID=A0A1V8TFB8_9PEZI|nr:hypothetical protein B0A48_04433 [Cryoendolithus antarcticus]
MPQELRDRKLPDCDATTYEDWDTLEDKGIFWRDLGAETFADDYIDSRPDGDYTDWAANMLEELIPKYSQADFDCTDPDGLCIVKASCEDFNAVGKGGLYYMYESMQNLHAFSKAYKTKLNEAAFGTAQQVGNMAKDLKLPDGEADTPLDIFAILSGAASIGSALTAANPLVAGGFGVISGALGALGQFQLKPQTPPDVGAEARATIDGMVGDGIKALQDNIGIITSSVFGKVGAKQDDIPMIMRTGGGARHPAVQVFGWGNSVKDHATEGLTEIVAKQKEKTDQALLWQMARLFKKVYIVIRDDTAVKNCNGKTKVWDADTSRCLDMFSWNGVSGSTLGGANDIIDIWGDYGMDPLATMRNAVDCWEASGGKVGTVQVNEVWNTDMAPRCFFGMEVVKRKCTDDAKGMMWMAGDFPGQEGMNGKKLWPVEKCSARQDRQEGECEYTWNEGDGTEKRDVYSFR